VAYGDNRTNIADHTAVVQSILRDDPKPELVVNVGDMVENGTISGQWGPQFFTPAHDLMTSTPMLPAFGNHEYQGGGGFDPTTLFSLPNNEKWYSFTYT